MTKLPTLSPTSIDALRSGKMNDPQNPGLAITVLPSGGKVWKYLRKLPGTNTVVKDTLGSYPANTIKAARDWAAALNEKVESGIDPRVVARADAERQEMTVEKAHGLYMDMIDSGSWKTLKPRSIKDKADYYRRSMKETIGPRCIHDITEDDLWEIIEDKAENDGAYTQANRTAAEMKVFFGWCVSRRGRVTGLKADPSITLSGSWYETNPNRRILNLDEIPVFLRALALEKRTVQRAMILWLLTATRKLELLEASTSEYRSGVWTLPADRVKNGTAHNIALGPWGRSLFQMNGEYVFPARVRADSTDDSTPTMANGWYAICTRITDNMSKISGKTVERFTPHALRRTMRSNTKRLKIDYETAEAMLNHLKQGLERIYDGYELEDEKAAAFLRWENEVIRIAMEAGVADILGCPVTKAVAPQSTGERLAA
ncbi:integrase arm-type DNA-binding domain-containing protein [Sphingomonas aurantiaca]|uniref:tyrosine-type recombinase/integrase n=1 Tax=Sphingomonas aurantiaca TaxID=185949 RepID=UPI002FE1E9A9